MKRLALLFVIAFVAVSAQAGVIFEDDFEDGTLDKWTIDGRQQGTGYAEVITKYDSQMAHLHHEGYTEVTIEKIFDYRPDLAFSFDMEAKVSSTYGSSSTYYSAAGVMFDFLDTDKNVLARAVIARSSSDYLFTYYNPLPNWEVFGIQDDLFHSYNVKAEDLLSYFDVNRSMIKYLNFHFWAYGSALQSSLIADTYADNVVITPEPATILLLGLGGLFLRGKRDKEG
jgi:hypothetical protein